MSDKEPTPFRLRELLRGDINRVRYTYRYNGSMVVHHESVAEHSWTTALYALHLGIWVTASTDHTVNMSILLSRAILHDIEEGRTGDFPRPFKHGHGQWFLGPLNDAAAIEAYNMLQMVMRPGPTEIGPESKFLYETWRHAKNDSIEGRILAFADFLSVVSYMWMELSAANITMLENYRDMHDYANHFDSPDYKFLEPLVTEAQQLVHRIYGSHPLSQAMEEYNAGG